jgi:hypothetical protein
MVKEVWESQPRKGFSWWLNQKTRDLILIGDKYTN